MKQSLPPDHDNQWHCNKVNWAHVYIPNGITNPHMQQEVCFCIFGTNKYDDFYNTFHYFIVHIQLYI